MKKYFNYLLLFIISLFFICGCTKKGLISYMDAKEKVINNHAVILDVRSSEDYNINHIDGAININLDSINHDNISTIIDTSEREIIVYCNDGTQSKQAVERIKQLGYTKVYDLGSINNWEE